MDDYNNRPQTDTTKIVSQQTFAENFEALFYLLGGSF